MTVQLKVKKNSARMFECLVTDKKIYCYALENKMPDNIKVKCANKLVASLYGIL